MVDQIRDRQDAQIWNAFDAGNLKQALKLVDKRLSKKHSDYHEAVKVYIRSKLPQLSEKSAVLLHLEGLSGRPKSITDLGTIGLYEEAFDEVLPASAGLWESWSKVIGELRWQAVKALPKDEDLCIECFTTCIKHDDLDHGRQIANSLEKNFPSKHEYIFWNITTMYIFSLSSKYPETQRNLWGRLALGQIGKLAAATKQAPNQANLPIKSIHAPQEVLLLLKITQSYGKPEQYLDYLKDIHLGPESTVAKGEWEIWRIKLKAMEEANEWQELFDITEPLLTRARTKNDAGELSESQLSDWVVWEAYIRSAVELGPGYLAKVRNQVETHLDPGCRIDKSWKRNASLAWVKLVFESAKIGSTPVPSETPSVKVLAILKYLEDFGDASTAYNDLRPFIQVVSAEERAELSSHLDKNDDQDLSTANKITRMINAYKIQYLLTCSLPEHERRQLLATAATTENKFHCKECTKSCVLYCQVCLGKLAQKVIASYANAIDDSGRITQNLLTTDRHPADDLCVLAANCLVKLSLTIGDDPASEPLKNTRTTYLLQAVTLLEYGWTHSKSNFQISLLLIRLYISLGCGSLAMRAYQRLALKQVQLDTLSYTLFDRISSFHPHPFSHAPNGATQFKSPIAYLQKQQKLYADAQKQIAKNIWLSFKHGSYNSILEIREVSETLSHSLSAATSVIESRKISRLIEPGASLNATSNEYGRLPRNPEYTNTELRNTNDYETFPNFEHTQGPRFEEISRVLPGPSAHRYRASLVAEKLFLIVAQSPKYSGERDLLNRWLIQHFNSEKRTHGTKMGSLGSMKNMTRAEDLAQYGYDAMLVIIRDACDQEQWTEPNYHEKLEECYQDLCVALEECTEIISGMKTIVPAFAVPLNALYAGQEMGRTTVDFCEFIAGQGTDIHERVVTLNERALEMGRRLLKTVVDKCMVIKKGLDEGGWIDKVLGSTFPEDEGVVIDEMSVEISGELQKLVDENFMEEMAGEVVESWGDSTMSLSYLKTPVN